MSDMNDVLEAKTGAPTVKLNKHGKPRAGGPRKRYKKKKGGPPVASEEASSAADEHSRHHDATPSQEESSGRGLYTAIRSNCVAEDLRESFLGADEAQPNAPTTRSSAPHSTPSQAVTLPVAAPPSAFKPLTPSLNPTAPSFVPPASSGSLGSVAEDWQEVHEQGNKGSSLNGPLDFHAFNEPIQDSFWMRLAAAGGFLGHGESSTDPVDESQSALEEYLREVEGFSAEHFGQDTDPFGFGPFDDLEGDNSSSNCSAYWLKHAFGANLELPPTVESSADAAGIRGRPRGRAHSSSSSSPGNAWSDRSGGNNGGLQGSSRGKKLSPLMPVVGDDGLPPRPSPVERFTSSSSHNGASLSSSPGASSTGAAAMESQAEALERAKWRRWVVDAAEAERQRRMLRLAALQEEEDAERDARRAWAAAAIEAEHRVRVSEQFLAAMTNSLWFTNRFVACSAATFEKYEIVCPYAHAGCAVVCPRRDLEAHLRVCAYAHGVARREREAMSSGPYTDGGSSGGRGNNMRSSSPTSSGSGRIDRTRRGRSGSASSAPGEKDATSEDSQVWDYEVVCPNAVMGCRHVCMRLDLSPHLLTCRFGGGGTAHQADAERARWRKVVEGQMEEERLRRVLENQRREYAYAAAAFAARSAEANIERAASAASDEQSSPSPASLPQDSNQQQLQDVIEKGYPESDSSTQLQPLPSSPRHRSLSPPSGARVKNANADATSWLPAQDRLVQQTTAPRRRGSTAEAFAEGHLHRSARAAATQAGAAAAAAAAARRPRYPSDSMGGDRSTHRSNSSRSDEHGNPNSHYSNTSKGNSNEGDSNSDDATAAAGMAALSGEIAAMAAAAEAATAARRSSYELILAQVQGVVGRLWSDGRVTPYGSFATGLMGEIGSDLDIVVCWDEPGSRNDEEGGDEECAGIQRRYQAPAYSVQRLAAALRRERRWVRVAKVLDRGKLPIIKAEARVDAPSNNSGSGKDSTATTSDEEWPPGCTTVALDISMFVPGHTGLVSSAFVKELVTHLPSLRPLCLVTKQLLKAHGLGDPYTGGVSAYAVVLMATFFLFQRRQQRLARAHALALCARTAAHAAEVAAVHSKHKAATTTSPQEGAPPPPPLPLLVPVPPSNTTPGLPGVPRRLKIPTTNQSCVSSSPSATNILRPRSPPVSPRILATQEKTTTGSAREATGAAPTSAASTSTAVPSHPGAQTPAGAKVETESKATEGDAAAEKKHRAPAAYAGAWRSGASAALVGDRAHGPPPPVHTYVPYTTTTAATVTPKSTTKGTKSTTPALPRRLFRQRDATTAAAGTTGLASVAGTGATQVLEGDAPASPSADSTKLTIDNSCVSPAANDITDLEDEKLPLSYAARVVQGHALGGNLTRPDRSWLKRQSSSPKQRRRSSSSPQSPRTSLGSHSNISSGGSSSSSSNVGGNVHPAGLSSSATNLSIGGTRGVSAHPSSKDEMPTATTSEASSTAIAGFSAASPAASPSTMDNVAQSIGPASTSSTSVTSHPDAFAFLGRHKARVALLYGQRLPLPHAAAAVLTPPKATMGSTFNDNPRGGENNGGSFDTNSEKASSSKKRSTEDDLGDDKPLMNIGGKSGITSEISRASVSLSPALDASEAAKSNIKIGIVDEGAWVRTLPKRRNSLRSHQPGGTNSPLHDGDPPPEMCPQEDTPPSAAAGAPTASAAASLSYTSSSQQGSAGSAPVTVPAASELEFGTPGSAVAIPPANPAPLSLATSSSRLSLSPSTHQQLPQRRRSSPHPPPGLPFDEDGFGMGEDSLAAMLLDFWQFWGVDFKAGFEGFSVRRGGFRFGVKGAPRHPQASDPVVIEDPVNVISNVGRSSYHFVKVQKLFEAARQTLAAQTAADSWASRLPVDNGQGSSPTLSPTETLESLDSSTAPMVPQSINAATTSSKSVNTSTGSQVAGAERIPRKSSVSNSSHTPPSILNAVLSGTPLSPAL